MHQCKSLGVPKDVAIMRGGGGGRSYSSPLDWLGLLDCEIFHTHHDSIIRGGMTKSPHIPLVKEDLGSRVARQLVSNE